MPWSPARGRGPAGLAASQPAAACNGAPRPAHADVPFRSLPFVPRDISIDHRADGSLLMQSRVPARPPEPIFPLLLASHARARPDATWLAQRRGPQGPWQRLRYGEAAAQVAAVTRALLALGLPGRCVVVLSANSLAHAVLQLAAMQARMPYVPITPAHSLLTQDLAKLQGLIDLLAPAVVFAQDGQPFDRALRGLVLPADARRVVVDSVPADLPVIPWADWLAIPPSAQAEAALAASVAAITPDTVAKYLFTSGSTGLPKAATITHRMLSVSIGMHRQVVLDPPGAPPSVLLDWMPWSHVASGNVMFGLLLAEGGELWIDDGKPVPGLIDQTLHNLRDVAPTL